MAAHKNDQGNVQKFFSLTSMRLLVVLVSGVAMCANGCIRNTLSMALVCMVNTTITNNSDAESNENYTCGQSSSADNDYHGTFLWGHYETGFMFSALFLGGLIATMPVGYLVDKYGPKQLVTAGILISSALCLLSPVAANQGGYIALAALRFFTGIFGQSVVVTSINSVIARWIPRNERSTALALSSAGNQISLIIGQPINALLCQVPYSNGWPFIFYVNGMFGFLSVVVWMFLMSNGPESSKIVSQSERVYIVACLTSQNARKTKNRSTPWLKILCSPALLALLTVNFAAGVTLSAFQNYVPTYFKEALYLDLTSNGLFSALPSICQWVGKIFMALVADMLKRRTNLSHTLISKVFNSISCFGGAAFLIACSYTTCATAGWAVAFMSLSFFMISGNVPGFQTSLISIAPAYTGTVTSLSRLAGQLAAVVTPLGISALTPNETVQEWRYVFYLIAILGVVAGILFLLFGSASVQSWARTDEGEKKAPIDNHEHDKDFVERF